MEKIDLIALAEALERYAQGNLKLEKFFDMTVNYFRCKCFDRTNLERRPPVSLCLRDPDHVFTLKPGYRSATKRRQQDGSMVFKEYGQMQFESVYIDCVSITELPPQDGRQVLQHTKACKLRLDESGRLSHHGAWYYRYAPSAVDEFVKVVNEFILFPWQILSRSKNRCCCCGKWLTDDVSRSRGIGPECLRSAALCFGEPRN
ncbi:MAG TPA: hypothetical protein DDZ51_01405 [Planctomycetaceae bacterium]|nr:hypothetical protein [Planctomycetaceae bacterium]